MYLFGDSWLIHLCRVYRQGAVLGNAAAEVQLANTIIQTARCAQSRWRNGTICRLNSYMKPFATLIAADTTRLPCVAISPRHR